MSLRIRLTIILLAFTLIPILFVSAITFNNYKSSLEAARLSELQHLVAVKAESIEAYFAELKLFIAVDQNAYIIKKYLPILNSLADKPADPEFITAKEALNNRLQGSQKGLKLSNIILVSPEGRVVYCSDPKHCQPESSKSLPEFVKKAVAEGKYKIYFSDVFSKKIQGQGDLPEMLITAPIHDFNGIFIGVIVAEVDMNIIYDSIKNTFGIWRTGEVLVGEKAGNEAVLLNPLKHDPKGAPGRRVTFGEKVGIGLQEAVQGRTGAGHIIDYRGEHVIAAWRYIPSIGWGMVAKIDKDEAFNDVENLKRLIGIILLMAVILGGIIAVSIAQSISKPIKNLTKGAEIIGGGNLDYKVGTDLKDEIGQLSRAFDKMAEDLKDAAVMRDAARKKTQETLETINETLEKQVEERTLQLCESEKQVRMKLESILSPEGDIGDLALGDILDSKPLQAVMDKFYELAHIPMAIIDIKGKVLVGVGWQDICTKFHRVNPETCVYCMESDTQLSAGIPSGEFRVYKCKNGLWDAATPIMIGDKHIGNIFAGQFFFEGEKPDYEFFRSQTKRHGFNEKDYIAALERVPRLTKEAVNNTMVFFMHFSHALSQLSYSNIKLAKLLAERDALTELLRESERQMNTAQGIARLGSWELDLEKNKLTWSDEVYRIFGLKPREFEATYEAFLRAVHPDDRAAVDAAYSNSVREGRDSYEIEHRIVQMPSGAIRFVHEKCEHIRDASGKIIRSIGMVHDITERKVSEAELLRAKEEWERTFDSVPDMIAILDDKHRIIRVNKAMAKALHVTPEKCGGLKCFEHVHGTSCPPDFCPHTQTLKDGKEHIAEIHEDRLGGDFLVSTTPIFDEEGRMKGAVHVARDITARKRSEEELRRITKVFKALNDNGYAMMNAKDEPEYLEEACKIIVNNCGHSLAWIGYAEYDEAKTVRPVAQAGFEDGYLGKLNITWADSSERGRGPTGTVIRTGKPAICRNILTDPNFKPWREEAAKRGYAASIVLPLASDNKVFGAVNIYSKDPDPFSEDEVRLLAKLADDIAYGVMAVRLRITNKKAEEVLKRDKDTLERLVREKSKELAGAQIELERAKRLSDIGTLAATVAHELRNPLAAMNMAAANIKRKAGNPALDKHIFTIEKKVTESNQIINNLLFYSRIKPPAYESVDLYNIIEECVNSAEEKAKEKATFENGADHIKGLAISADPTQIKEVINNILNNAVDAIPENKGKIRVRVENKDDYVTIDITDNGGGIAKDHLDRIFDPFFTTKARGTGLGLSVCRQIIDFHEGSIGIKSAPGEGTTVTVRLPNKGKPHE